MYTCFASLQDPTDVESPTIFYYKQLLKYVYSIFIHMKNARFVAGSDGRVKPRLGLTLLI